ncbi:guanine nucleotide exchange factor VAV2-like [Diadema setosum]|uniref:guanine nucleotide exchange factor VAV2-like n=1 Tax=Diadema setosum TaxID=31175 RepID=UPI003B3AB5FA
MSRQESWRQCARWLVECGALHREHKIMSPTAEAFDLGQTLRDGVILCHLLNHIKPGCIDTLELSNIRSQTSQFLCMKNIRTFLRACSRVFNIREADFFDPAWLYQMSDFGSLIDLLSKLSHTEDAQRTGAIPFSTVQEDIYGGLEDMADEHDLQDEGEIYDTVDEDEGDKIYDDLVNIRREIKQAHAQRTSTTESMKVDKREFCRREIVETEQKYVEALHMLCEQFIKPLRQVLNRQDIDTIFLNIEELHRRHRAFFKDLQDAFQRPSPTMAQAFKKHKKNFLVYGYYCSMMLHAQNHIEKVSANQAVRMKIEECQRIANDNKFRLRDLLSVPMQRILKYHLLLKELVKHTDKKHRERKELDEALDEMQDLSLYVNEVKRDYEIMQTNEAIQGSLVNYKGVNLNEYGRNQKDGELKIRLSGGNKRQMNARYCFLFDKVMLICKSGRLNVEKLWGQESHEYQTTIDLAQYKVEDNLPSGRSGRWNWCFHLTPKEPSNNRGSVEVYCKTEEMMLRWVEGIRLAQENIQPRNSKGHKVEYTSFKTEDPSCDSCHKLLRGCFFQGYKCTACGISVHKECLTSNHTPSCHMSNHSSNQVQIRPGRRYTALHPYNGSPLPPNNEQIVPLCANDMVQALENVNPMWTRVKVVSTSQIGVVPSSILGEQYEQHVLPIRQPTTHQQSAPSPTPEISGLFSYPWYVGEMERPEANEKLLHKPGCFLVRKGRRGYAVSLEHEGQIKHMKVVVENGQFGLAEQTLFLSLPDMISHYSTNSLVNVFKGLDAYLRKPLRTVATVPENGLRTNRRYNVIGHAKAMYDFSARDTRELTLMENEEVAIISKAGGHRGWWKGCIGDRVGYFPSTYVEELDNGAPI